MKDYIKKIRSRIGHDHFIHPATRILIENDQNQFLMIKRVDNGNWGLPAGGFEEGETILQCIKREVKEETGLDIYNPILIGVATDPKRETVTYPNGDKTQYFTIEFYCNTYKGIIHLNDTEEIQEALWVEQEFLDLLPHNESFIIKSWKFYQDNGFPLID